MIDKEALIWYIYHSGFAVKTLNHFLVFDYYRDNPGNGLNIDALLLQETENREVIVFASHGHGDHFTPTIFEWQDGNKGVKYILSSDIELQQDTQDIIFISPGHKYQVGNVAIEALDSTDLGVAFLVSCDGITIFHAGDLNWWHWQEDSDAENSAMADKYKEQIDLLKGKTIDLAFIPVDPRLEEYYGLGITYFMQVVGANKVFPMHFGMDYSVFEKLNHDLPTEHLERLVEITPTDRKFTYRARP